MKLQISLIIAATIVASACTHQQEIIPNTATETKVEHQIVIDRLIQRIEEAETALTHGEIKYAEGVILPLVKRSVDWLGREGKGPMALEAINMNDDLAGKVVRLANKIYWETGRDKELLELVESYLPEKEQVYWCAKICERNGHYKQASKLWMSIGETAFAERAITLYSIRRDYLR